MDTILIYNLDQREEAPIPATYRILIQEYPKEDPFLTWIPG